jgi:hypothetical protein
LVSTSIAISPDASDSACWSPSILPDGRDVPNPRPLSGGNSAGQNGVGAQEDSDFGH